MITIDTTSKIWVYHHKECQEGKILPLGEGRELLEKRNGWVKTPNDFQKAENKPLVETKSPVTEKS